MAIDIGGPQYTRQDQDFVNAIIENRTVESDALSGYNVQKIVDAIYISSDNQGRLESISYNG